MPEKSKALARQVSELSERIDRLESKLGARPRRGAQAYGADDAQAQCHLPDVPERTFDADVSPHRAQLIRYFDRKWVNGTRLHYYFFESGHFAGAEAQVEIVRQGFAAWEALGIGVAFEEVSDITEAEVRIGFLQGDGAWSYVGRDVIDVPGQFERTMNFGWDLTRDPRGVDTAIHEIGHTLGFPHEHQNPFAGIVWNEQAVYDFFGGPPNNWPRNTTFHNVLRKLPIVDVEGSEWDPDSVMHYAFPAGLIERPEPHRAGIRPAPGLSEGDVATVRQFYPPLNDALHPMLEVFRSQFLSLEPGEQKNFRIEPEATRNYTIQTFGQSDTVVVLFEDDEGDPRFVAGDDDSGTHLNARLHVRLYKGRRYLLRIRLYSNYASGDTAIMLW